MIDKSMIDAVAKLGTDATGVTAHRNAIGDGRAIVECGGAWRWERPEIVVADAMATPAELFRYAEEVGDKIDETAVMLLSPTGISLRWGEMPGDPHTASCPLPLSEPWRALIEAPRLQQADFVRLLRVTLRGCLPSPDLLAAARSVKFDFAAATEGEVQHGRESLGRSVVAAVKGAGAFPEETTILVRPWTNVAEPYIVRCALELDVTAKSFRLVPYPCELADTMRKAMEDLAAQCRELAPSAAIYLAAESGGK